MQKTKKEKSRAVSKTLEHRGNFTTGRERQDSRQSLPEPTENTCSILRSFVLKEKFLLDINEHLAIPEFSFDNYEMLGKLVELAPDIEKNGDTIGEVLSNAIKEIERRAFVKFEVPAIDIRLTDSDINFYVPYDGMDTMFSYSLISLYYIEKKHKWIIPYIFTVLDHLEEVNHVPFPDFEQGEESAAIESMICTDGEENEELESYVKKLKKEYGDFQKRVQKEKISIKDYLNFPHLTPNKKSTQELLSIGKKLLECKDEFYDFIHHPEEDHYGVDGRTHHRFFWNMDGDDSLFQYLASGYDTDWGEGGSTGFYKPVPYTTNAPIITGEDFPILLHQFLDKLWDLTHECTPKRKNND